jgi:hypothetical protein
LQLASRVIAKAGNHPDRFHGGKAAHQAYHRPQYANFRTVVAIIRV